jgi:UDP:flavonoid glycosyltransferase YjiC (YdhE family)
MHPESRRMVWWEDSPDGMIPPDPRPVFNPLLKKLKLPEIGIEAKQLVSGDLFIFPSIPILDPLETLPSNSYYVGAIINRFSQKKQMPVWFKSLTDEKPVIYVTVGGSAGHIGSGIFFGLINQTFKDGDFQVIVSTGRKFDPKAICPIITNIKIVQWISNAEMIARSNLVIFHGGYTRMEILMQGIPSVVMPFHSEQEYYGRLMEKTGVSRLVHFSEGGYQKQLCYWKGGNHFMKSKPFTVHFRSDMTLKPDVLRKAVVDCLSDPNMKLRANAIKTELEKHNGAEEVFELIKNKLGIF